MRYICLLLAITCVGCAATPEPETYIDWQFRLDTIEDGSFICYVEFYSENDGVERHLVRFDPLNPKEVMRTCPSISKKFRPHKKGLVDALRSGNEEARSTLGCLLRHQLTINGVEFLCILAAETLEEMPMPEPPPPEEIG